MIPEKICKLTLPFSPYYHEGESDPVVSKRVRPKDALNLGALVSEMGKSAISSYDILGNPWSVISVFSPYTPNTHVMLMEQSPNRYLPGIEWIPEDEGEQVMELIGSVMSFLATKEENATLHAGYNWSPRSWGENEEKNGFQSIPTKWHPMLWGWPDFDSKDAQSSEYVEWVDVDSLPPLYRRLLGDNDYSLPLCRYIQSSIESAFRKSSFFYKYFAWDETKLTDHTLTIPFSISLPQLFSTSNFFSKFLKPLACMLENTFRGLTEVLTDQDCHERDMLLSRCASEGDEILPDLRKPPHPFEKSEVLRKASEKGFPQDLVKLLIPSVFRRCMEEGEPSSWWRMGFGYSMMFSASKHEDKGKVIIMPGPMNGPGGIVESHNIILERPEYVSHSEDAFTKSKVLWELNKYLSELDSNR